MARFLAVLVVSLGIAACSFLTDTSGLVANDGEAAGPGGGDGATSPTEIDSGAGDGAGDGDDGPFCARQPAGLTFCDDFDTAALEEKWDEPGVRRTRNGAEVEVQSSTARSAPNALQTRLSASAPDCAYASVEKSFPGSFVGGKVSVEIHYEMDPSVATLVALALRRGGQECEVFYNARSGKLARYEIRDLGGGSPDTRYVESELPFPAGAWNEVEIDTDFRSGEAVVTIDGASETISLLGCPLADDGGTVALLLGFACEDSEGVAREARFDNVTFVAR